MVSVPLMGSHTMLKIGVPITGDEGCHHRELSTSRHPHQECQTRPGYGLRTFYRRNLNSQFSLIVSLPTPACVEQAEKTRSLNEIELRRHGLLRTVPSSRMIINSNSLRCGSTSVFFVITKLYATAVFLVILQRTFLFSLFGAHQSGHTSRKQLGFLRVPNLGAFCLFYRLHPCLFLR